MNGLTPFYIAIALLFVLPIIVQIWWNRKISNREQVKGDIIEKAQHQGPDEMDVEMIKQQSEVLHRDDGNVLSLTERQILALFGLARVAHLGIDEIRHEMGEPVVTVVVYERVLRYYGLPVGFKRSVRYTNFDLPIQDLDEVLGEEVIFVEGDVGVLKAVGISSYEEEVYECEGKDYELRIRPVREWTDDGEGYAIDRRKERVYTNPSVEWGELKDG